MKAIFPKYLFMALVCALFLTGPAAADSEPRYNQVRLQAQQSESVSNDTMHVTLVSHAEERDPADLARKINAAMEWALEKSRATDGVKVSTGSYRTWPLTVKGATRNWRGEQELMLEGRDSAVLAHLVGDLQERLQIRSMNFTVSDELRVAVENRLMGAALDAFSERARIVGDKLHANGYRIVDLNVGTSSRQPPVLYKARMAATMEADQAVAVEGGESDIQVTVSGTVELNIP